MCCQLFFPFFRLLRLETLFERSQAKFDPRMRHAEAGTEDRHLHSQFAPPTGSHHRTNERHSLTRRGNRR